MHTHMTYILCTRICIWYYDDNNDGSRLSIFAVRFCYLYFYPAFQTFIVTWCYRPTSHRRTPTCGRSVKSVIRPMRIYYACIIGILYIYNILVIYSTCDLHTMRTGFVALYCIISAAYNKTRVWSVYRAFTMARL